MSEQDNLETRLAAFAIEALAIDDNPASLATEVEEFKRDDVAGISTIELDSSVGVVAFLIYHYAIEKRNEDGKSGGELFEADLKILERAAKLDSPGPRIVAHAVTNEEAFILATSPTTHRALTGSAETEKPSLATLTDEEIDTIRRDTAAALAETLKNANVLADQWLQAIRSASGSADDTQGTDQDILEFNEDETALALMLLDESRVKQLLRVMNLVVESAKHQLSDSNGLATDEGQDD